MIYAYDLNIQYPVKDLYDSLMIAMSISAAKDMYDKGQSEIKEFNKTYGDFMSPFAKDMQRYNQIVGGVRDTIDQLYANGIDPIRSAEGRAAISRAIASVNPAELSAMRANAKTGYAYLDALQKLRQSGKYSQAQEDFDLALTGATPFDQFVTSDGTGFNTWTRTSPIEASTLLDLTYNSYKNRTPRALTKEDFEKDPALRKMAFDPRYEYTGYIDSDLMKVAPGASAALAGDPRALYFRDLARQKVIAAGLDPTEGNIEAQFQRDIADANKWALVDPVRKADAFALEAQKHANDIDIENRRHAHAMARQRAANAGGNKSTKEATSYGQTLLQRGIANWAGSSDPGAKGLLRAKNFAASTKNMASNMRSGAFLNFYSMPDAESTSSWISRFHGDPSRTKSAATGGVNYVGSMDNKKLFTAKEITSNTIDYPGYPQGWSKKHIPGDASMVPTGRVYTAPMNDGTYSQYVEVKVGNNDSSQTLFYKVAETEPQPLVSNVDAMSNPVWGTPRNDQPIAPYGFSTIPSQRTTNQWAIQDAGLNAAARLAGEQTHAGQGIFLDNLPLD